MGKMIRQKRPINVIARKPPSKLQRVAKDVAKLKKDAAKVEHKIFDKLINASNINTVATVTYLNEIGPGNTAITHVGNQYRVRKIQISGTVQLETNTDHDELRIALVRVKRPNEVVPTYNGGDNAIYSAASPDALREYSNRGNFVIMREWNILLNDTGVNSRKIEYNKRVDLVTTISNAEDGTAGTEIEQNAYYLVHIGSTAAAATNSVLTAYVRFTFTDE